MAERESTCRQPALFRGTRRWQRYPSRRFATGIDGWLHSLILTVHGSVRTLIVRPRVTYDPYHASAAPLLQAPTAFGRHGLRQRSRPYEESKDHPVLRGSATHFLRLRGRPNGGTACSLTDGFATVRDPLTNAWSAAVEDVCQRIRRLGVRIPPSAPRSEAIFEALRHLWLAAYSSEVQQQAMSGLLLAALAVAAEQVA